MKLFISADIEGCAGVALAYETHKNEAAYGEFAKQMTKEVVAACEAAHEARGRRDSGKGRPRGRNEH